MSDPERWKRIIELFDQAVAQPDPGAWLKAECGSDEAVFNEVSSLLAARDAEHTARREEPPRLPQRRYGAWEPVEFLGSGGMGSVLKVRRADGAFEQAAALKLIAPHLAGPYFLDRFRVERQILAQLNHRNIAKLIDGGSTEEGEPYLVMEFVAGLPLDRYADENKLPLRARLELFLKVCDAVDFAHRNLIVHRDLKPGNIFVESATGEPKLLDFGTARMLTDPDASATTLRLVTPRYASPEALLHAPITTQADVFSLGVLLYEQVSGRWPFGEAVTPADAIARISAAEISPPQERITQETAEARSSTVRELRSAVRGDLARILRKATEADLERRYKSCAALARDIRAFLNGQPVSAQDPTWVYRSSKFLQRHWLPASALALLIVGLAAAAMFSYQKAREATLEADRSFAALMGLKQMIESAAAGAEARTMTVTELISRNEKLLENADPATRPSALASLSYISLTAGDLPEAERRARAAIAAAESSADRFAEADARVTLANTRAYQGRLNEGVSESRRALKLAENLGNLRRVRAIRFRANQVLAYLSLLRAKPEPDTAAIFEEAIRLGGADPLYRRDLVWIYRLLAQFRATQQDDAGQQAALDAGMKIYREQKNPNLVEADILEAYRAFLGARKRDYAGAEHLARERFELASKLAGAEHFAALDPHIAWGLELGRSGHWDAGARELSECRKQFDALPPAAKAVSGWKLMYYSALVENRRNNPVDAESFARQAFANGAAVGWDRIKDNRLGEAALELGTALRLQGKFAEAQVELRRAHDIFTVGWGPSAPRTRNAAQELQRAEQRDASSPAQ